LKQSLVSFLARFRNRLLLALVIVIAASVALALDLRFHGLAWRVMYSVTGEESPIGQLSGFVYYLGNLTRRQPVADVDTGFKRFEGNPLGVNTFLEQEVEESKRERQLQMIQDAGFGWIRQQFPWQDIEIKGRGNFMDDRNGPPIDAWKKYDHIVDLADKYNIRIIVRLGVPPTWSQPPGALPTYTPPTDLEDFANYAKAVATRYKGRITYYQVWNEPNVYPEWGERAVNPEAYTDLLCRTYRALKTVDPSIQVISATLAQTVALSERDLSDFVFLQRMYNAGAGACFDILGAQGYGLFSGPTDRRMRVTTINYSHVVWLRDLMVANGDAAKQIWIGEMAWNPVPDEESVPDIQGRLNYGQVTDEQAARYAVEGYARARQEWPWVGVINYWYFKKADESEKNQSQYYFRLVDPDFTPRPIYEAIRDYRVDSCAEWHRRGHLGTCLSR
jgi:polysaccharide biosynthesis protein PslG